MCKTWTFLLTSLRLSFFTGKWAHLPSRSTSVAGGCTVWKGWALRWRQKQVAKEYSRLILTGTVWEKVAFVLNLVEWLQQAVFIHSFHKNLLRSYYESGTALSAGDIPANNKIEKKNKTKHKTQTPPSLSVHSRGRSQMVHKWITKCILQMVRHTGRKIETG